MTPSRLTRPEEFEAARGQLLGLAYRMLGNFADAEDVVQDCAFKWLSDTDKEPDNPRAWLVKMCTNRCLDVLRSAARSRISYVGPWLPDQFETESDDETEMQLEIATTLSTAFLLMLERLTPRERAAYLLHDIFEMPFEDVAQALRLTSESTRKLASRARKMITQENVRFVPTIERQSELLGAFEEALRTGMTAHLELMLAEDVDLRADSGGKVVALQDILVGRSEVLSFITSILKIAWTGFELERCFVNGQQGLRVVNQDTIHALVSFGFGREGHVQNLFIQRNPDKLIRNSELEVHLNRQGGIIST